MTTEEITAKLQSMIDSPDMITEDSFSPNTALYPDNRMPFTDRHLAYLKTHKYVDPAQYISNLQLMITKR